MTWINVNKSLPESGKRILIYSPIYDISDSISKKNFGMLYRTMNSQFFDSEIMSGVTHWMYLEPPKVENTD